MMIAEDILQADLMEIIAVIEKKQRAHLNRLEEKTQIKKAPLIWTPDEKTKILDDIHNQDILETLVKDMEILGYQGMEDLKKTLYLVCVSRLTPLPICVLQIANSAAGKSLGQDMALSFMPEDICKYNTTLTPAALSHYGTRELCENVLCVDEFAGFSEISYPYLRSFISKGMAVKTYTEVSKLTGEMQNITKELHVADSHHLLNNRRLGHGRRNQEPHAHPSHPHRTKRHTENLHSHEPQLQQTRTKNPPTNTGHPKKTQNLPKNPKANQDDPPRNMDRKTKLQRRKAHLPQTLLGILKPHPQLPMPDPREAKPRRRH